MGRKRGAYREPMDKNRLEGAAKQGKRAMNRKALATKARRCRCGGCAMKVCVLTWGDLALCLKGRQRRLEREVIRRRWSDPADSGYLNAGIMDDGAVMERQKGTPQGGPLSPLLANFKARIR